MASKAKKNKDREADRKNNIKALESSVKLAADALSKISSVKATLEAATTSQAFAFVPTSVQEDARKSLADLTHWAHSAQAVITRDGDLTYCNSFPATLLRTRLRMASVTRTRCSSSTVFSTRR